ncbi:MAG: formyltetrahydrofolate deformylase [Nitriliruptorales bacterium]|nr:formyltetrahydrofolate deformylase [Nitriliruptorales bacterium]
MTVHILTLTCPDRPGIVASIAEGLFELGGNILENAQYSDEVTNTFCIRTRFEADEADPATIASALADRASSLGADLDVRREADRMRTVVMVSKQDHCLRDLLYRWQIGELPVDVRAVVSNHPNVAPLVEDAGIRFEHVPISKDTKPQAEARLVEILDEENVELVVLARYMQILSDGLCELLAGRCINIHHSFLPGFKGARPYHQAWEHGVKLIGATAHYVTAGLDEGPIIDQGVERVTHHATVDDFVAVGRDIERLVLSRAVRAHAEHRVFLIGGRTVVFP